MLTTLSNTLLFLLEKCENLLHCIRFSNAKGSHSAKGSLFFPTKISILFIILTKPNNVVLNFKLAPLRLLVNLTLPVFLLKYNCHDSLTPNRN